MSQDLSTQVTRSLQAVIAPLSASVSLDAPLVAINWFDTRSLTLYNIYNVLASRSVTSVGGEVVIKGKVTEVLAGNPEDQRDVLLIVRYPSGPQFMKMMQSTYFKLVSLLRSAAVSRFTFGFTQPTARATPMADPSKDMTYLIHHYRGADYGADLARLAAENDVDVVYAGQAAAQLATRKADGPFLPVPSLWDGVLVLQTKSKAQLVEFVGSEAFATCTQASETSFSALFRRLL